MILVITLVCRIGGDIFIPSIPKIAGEFNINQARATFNINLYAITLALSFAFLGPLADVMQKRTLLMYGCIACCLSYMVGGLAEDIILIDFGRLLLAMGSGLIIVTSQTWIGDHSSKKDLLGRLAWFSLVIALAPMLAPALGGYITDHFSWRWTFWLMLILTLPVFWLIIKLPVMPEIPQSGTHLHPLTVLKSYMDILRNSDFLNVNVVGFVLFMLQGAFLTFSTFLFIDEFGISAAEFGLLSILFAAAMLLGRFPTLWMEKHFPIRSVYMLNVAVIIFSLAGSYLFFLTFERHTLLEIMFFMLLMRVGFSGIAILGVRNVMLLDPARKGTLSGLYSFLNHFSGWLGVVLTQVLFAWQLTSLAIYNAMLIISLVLTVTGTVLFLTSYAKVKDRLEN